MDGLLTILSLVSKLSKFKSLSIVWYLQVGIKGYFDEFHEKKVKGKCLHPVVGQGEAGGAQSHPQA